MNPRVTMDRPDKNADCRVQRQISTAVGHYCRAIFSAWHVRSFWFIEIYADRATSTVRVTAQTTPQQQYSSISRQ